MWSQDHRLAVSRRQTRPHANPTIRLRVTCCFSERMLGRLLFLKLSLSACYGNLFTRIVNLLVVQNRKPSSVFSKT